MSGEVHLGQSSAIYDNGQRQDPVNNHASRVSLGFEGLKFPINTSPALSSIHEGASIS